jgi:hypothetical protein
MSNIQRWMTPGLRWSDWWVSVAETSPLLGLLAGDDQVELLGDDDFSLALAEARACGLTGRLAHMLSQAGCIDFLSPAHQDQLLAADIQSCGFRQDVLRELEHIELALSRLGTPVILLKGASYVHLGLPASEGRFFSDIDILVPRSHLAAAEAALMLGGWSVGKLDPYKQRYYRKWSHEIPPMTHLQRGTTLDLHHSLVMPTCRVRVDSARMTAAAVPAKEGGFWWRLRDEDLVLHAASHLLLNAEFDRGLRDLWDIDLLVRHFTLAAADFPEQLLTRARDVGLETILLQVLWLATLFFRTPLPQGIPLAKKTLFLRLVARAASTRHPATRPWGQGGADFALMLREMYLRLPSKLLAVHLWHKVSSPFAASQETWA